MLFASFFYNKIRTIPFYTASSTTWSSHLQCWNFCSLYEQTHTHKVWLCLALQIAPNPLGTRRDISVSNLTCRLSMIPTGRRRRQAHQTGKKCDRAMQQRGHNSRLHEQGPPKSRRRLTPASEAGRRSISGSA